MPGRFASPSKRRWRRVHVLNALTPRARALEVFAHLRVWDTEHNNGVLIYVQLADRDVEIVADRGFAGRVSPAEWEAVCRLMEEHFRAGRFRNRLHRRGRCHRQFARAPLPAELKAAGPIS